MGSKDDVNLIFQQKSKYFDSFLFHEMEAGKGTAYTELLWKYHERNGNYLDAARVLVEMASKTTRLVFKGVSQIVASFFTHFCLKTFILFVDPIKIGKMSHIIIKFPYYLLAIIILFYYPYFPIPF